MTELPIDHVLPDLKQALRDSPSVVLQAPPGAGKTTRVPPALLDEPWLGGNRIVMLEPRRLAARAAARYMAAQYGEEVGGTVGYRMRMETRVGPGTKIEVVTEGVLTRMIQSDPALDGVGLVIFDEFHERSLHADLGLALTLQSQSLLREDLRLLVMSATLNGEAIAALLGDAPIVTSRGRSYPVETRYLERPVEGRTEHAVAVAVRRALEKEQGDILVFLPGVGEIRRTEALLREQVEGPHVHIVPLHGNLPGAEQDRAVAPGRSGQRKVVLSTSIAETSLTIDGIRVVVDCGLMRVPRFSPRSGMARLETTRVSRASADQRCGRAGRLGPGVCYRLWPEIEQSHLLPFSPPEILEADLAPLALDLAEWGIADPTALSWLDLPPAGTFAQARELLTELGALTADGIISDHGRRMASFGLHPRLAHAVLKGKELGMGATACDLASLLNERDLFRGRGDTAPDADLRLRLETLRSVPDKGNSRTTIARYDIDRGALHRIAIEADHWRRRLGTNRETDAAAIESCGILVAMAYPDRIAQRRPGTHGRFLLRNGRSAMLPDTDSLADAAFLAVAELDGRGRESRIFLAAPITLEDVEAYFAEQIEQEEIIRWDGEAGTVIARRRRRLGALLLSDVPMANPDPEAVVEALLEGIREEGIETLPWNRAATHIRERLAFLHRIDASWPDVSNEHLSATLAEWLGPYLHGRKRRQDLAGLDLGGILPGTLSWEQRSALDELAPSHLTVPSGSRIAVDYSDPGAPTLAVRLQEMFGMIETPRVARGAVPVTVQLLSPANRPVQVTRDLANFWRTTYFEVRKDLKGRYPKHYWPDDPMEATPTRRVRPR